MPVLNASDPLWYKLLILPIHITGITFLAVLYVIGKSLLNIGEAFIFWYTWLGTILVLVFKGK